MELFLLYIWLKLGVISGFLIGVGLFLMALTIVCLMYYAIEKDKFYAKTWRNVAFVFVVFFVANFIPTQKEAAILVGTHYALKVTDTPEAAKVMTLLRQKANEMLDEQLKSEKKAQ